MSSASRIILYGVPGAGKSTIARLASSMTGLPYLELDDVRLSAQHHLSRDQDPFVYEFTTEAWKRFGDLTPSNVEAGLRSVRTALEPYVLARLASMGSVLAEAVFVDPAAHMKGSDIILITIPDEKRHYSQFFVNRPRSADEDVQFQAARYMQNFLKEEAARLGIAQISNDKDPQAAARSLLERFGLSAGGQK